MVNGNDKKLTCWRTVYWTSSSTITGGDWGKEKIYMQKKKVLQNYSLWFCVILIYQKLLSLIRTAAQGKRNQCSLNKCTFISQIWLCWLTPFTLNYSTENLSPLPVSPQNYREKQKNPKTITTTKPHHKQGAATKGRNRLQISGI